jgi:hypothetical protein
MLHQKMQKFQRRLFYAPVSSDDNALIENFSYKGLGVGGAIIISAWITHRDKRALLVLNLASNSLYAEGIELLAEALKGNQIMTELNVSGNAATWDRSKYGEMSGVIALADAISDMAAMTSLDLSGNCIGPEGVKHIAGAVKASKCVLAIILAPLSCQSDQYFNCWCLLLSPGYGGTISAYLQRGRLLQQ